MTYSTLATTLIYFKKNGKNGNFNDYSLMGWSESNLSLKNPEEVEILLFFPLMGAEGKSYCM